jgi:maltodextrin utilization protein YvdJ
MIEKVKAVNNPLTIIAIFAALAEIAGTVALKMVAPEFQGIFIWFVMGFPTLLIILFFLTLNFNPKVLYAPSDFKDEVNFLNTLGGVRQLSGDLSEVQKQLDGATTKIVEDIAAKIGTANQEQISQLSELVDNRINVVRAQIEKTKESANEIADTYTQPSISEAITVVLDLFSVNHELCYGEIYKGAHLSVQLLQRVLRTLVTRGVLEARIVAGGEDGKDSYAIYRLRKDVKGFQI